MVVEKAPTIEEISGWKIWFAKRGIDVSLGKRQLEGWSGPLKLYLYKCAKCGELHICHPQGFRGILPCLRREK